MNNVFVLDIGRLGPLAHRLKKNMTLRARIVQRLDSGRYILRFLGINILMKSELNFTYQEEIDLQIMELSPHVTLKYLKPGYSPKLLSREQQLMDILI
jgi:hypothetical protein